MHVNIEYLKPVSLIAKAHDLVRGIVKVGDNVIDATIGNGHDTLFLSQLVNAKGKVYGFDIQRSAIDNTRALLSQHKCMGNTKLSQCCHSRIATTLYDIDPSIIITAAVFNLGYLPGSDKSIITQTNTTLQALDSLLPLLATQGGITLLAYRGHAGGEFEADALLEYCHSLNTRGYYTSSKTVTLADNIPPILFSITNFDSPFHKIDAESGC